MAKIHEALLCLLLFAVSSTGGQFSITTKSATFCEGSFTSLALECTDFSESPTKQPLWIRWDQNGTEIWRSGVNNNDPYYYEAKPYNSDKAKSISFLLISNSVLTVADDNNSFACINKGANNRKINTEAKPSAAFFHILPKECCGMSSCGSTTPVTRLITSPAEKSPETNQMSTSSSEKSSAPVAKPSFDASKCLVSVEQLKNEKDDPSYQNMGIDAAGNKEYTTLLWFIAVCVFIATISIVFVAYRVYKMSRMLQIQSFRDRAPTDATEMPMLYPNNNNVH